MRLFGWMQNKLNGKQGSNKSSTSSSAYQAKQEAREEFSDWPQGLLAIGTFGKSEIKENTDQDHDQNGQSSAADHHQEFPSSSHDQELLDNFTPEEVGQLQKELTKLLSRSKPNVEKENADLPLDRFLNCPSSLEVDRRISSALHSDNSDPDYKDEDIDRTISVILGRCKDLCAATGNNKKAGIIGKKSISFLFKKMFVCRSGFAPQPSLRDTLQESRMEKIWCLQLLRMMLHKKINPQNASRASSMKKYIEDKQVPKKRNGDQDQEPRDQTDDGCKWVKTDSEYIVLEI